MKTSNINNYKYMLTLLCVLTFFSCEEFVQIDLPNSQISKAAVFDSDKTAIAVATGMYKKMTDQASLIGSYRNSIAYLGGLSSDELIDHTGTAPYAEFFSNQLNVENTAVAQIWSSAYSTIYEANAIIEGIKSSAAVSMKTKNQVEGEAKFVRALCHFYLVNLFDDIPIVTATDYRINSTKVRSATNEVYDQIIFDLKEAKELLTDDYFTTGRTRPNKWAAAALLSRVYLYRKDYLNAENEATTVIDVTAKYNLLTDLSKVFLTNSNESIWQLMQVYPLGYPTGDAAIFIISNNFFTTSLSNYLLAAFETGDSRRTTWVASFTSASGATYYSSKYKTKIYTTDGAYPEALTVLRLAELYLIRSEARAQQEKISEAQSDLNTVRNRANLGNTTADNKSALLDAIAQERRIELFCEFGHRWLDLKRTGTIDATMSSIKPSWNSEHQLFPIPASEFTTNPFLAPQNKGY